MMKKFLRTFPLLLIGISIIGFWGTFYSDFFGLGFIIPLLSISCAIVYAFTDFYRITHVKTIPVPEKKEKKSIRKYVDAAPFSLGLLSMLSLFGAGGYFSAYGDRYGGWCFIPTIIDLILILLAFREFYRITIDKDSKAANKS